MDLNTKITMITICYNRALNDLEYKINVDWEKFNANEIKIYLENCRQFIKNMDQLDLDKREEGIANWHRKLDEILSIFPEHKKNDVEENTKAK